MKIRQTGTPVLDLLGKVGLEYLTAPMHVILAASMVRLLGGFRRKVLFDQFRRREHAFGMLAAADVAMQYGYERVSVIEFGVASGGGLINLFDVGRHVTQETGVKFDIYGFDTGEGLPLPVDYRDHPESFQTGDYPLVEQSLLSECVDETVKLVIGDVSDTVPEFIDSLDSQAPLGFFTVDVDYYSSAVGCLRVLQGDSQKYLPHFWCYFDDVSVPSANLWCGELLAIEEFNEKNVLRKIHKDDFLRSRRVFKNSDWIDMMRSVHILDHEARSTGISRSKEVSRTANALLGIQK